MARQVKALFISDVHLGSRGTKAEELLEVLKEYEPQTLYIVGDFIDGWLLKKRHYWPQSHTNIVRKILSYTKRGSKVVYITGNHDDFLRNYDHEDFGNITIMDEVIVDDHLIIHGDKFDGIVMSSKWLAELGSIAYELVILLNNWIKAFRKGFGLRPRSFSKWVKAKVRSAYLFISTFERTLADYAEKHGCHTVICGHIHTAEDKMVGEVRYLNCGDWIENYSYLVWDESGIKLHTKNDGVPSATKKSTDGSHSGV
jgi:UDP-2,3-diacylglucosamine pyrophosphatase LpxH